MNLSCSLPGYRNVKVWNGIQHATTLSQSSQNPYQAYVCQGDQMS